MDTGQYSTVAVHCNGWWSFRHRLYCKGVFISHRRGKRNVHPQQSLIKIDGVANKGETDFYLGKRLAYVYKVHKRGKGIKRLVCR